MWMSLRLSWLSPQHHSSCENSQAPSFSSGAQWKLHEECFLWILINFNVVNDENLLQHSWKCWLLDLQVNYFKSIGDAMTRHETQDMDFRLFKWKHIEQWTNLRWHHHDHAFWLMMTMFLMKLINGHQLAFWDGDEPWHEHNEWFVCQSFAIIPQANWLSTTAFNCFQLHPFEIGVKHWIDAES